MPVDKFGRMSDTKTRDTGISLTYINNNYVRRDGRTPATGSINMNGNTLYNVSDPVNPQDVATKAYADKVGGGSPFLKEKNNNNYKATHTINMGFRKLLNLQKPTEQFDAATKDYVDYVVETLKERLNTIDKRNHLISVAASFQGDFIEGAYPFTFCGQNYGDQIRYNMFNAFLMPYSGYIKRFVLKDYGLKVFEDFDERFIYSGRKLPLFTLVLITKTHIIDLVTVNLLFKKVESEKEILPKREDYPFLTDEKFEEFLETTRFYYLQEYSCTSTLPGDFKDYKLNEGNVLNIRSEVTSLVQHESEASPRDDVGVTHFIRDFYGNIEISPTKNDYEDISRDFNFISTAKENSLDITYLATILLELDPL